MGVIECFERLQSVDIGDTLRTDQPKVEVLGCGDATRRGLA